MAGVSEKPIKCLEKAIRKFCAWQASERDVREEELRVF